MELSLDVTGSESFNWKGSTSNSIHIYISILYTLLETNKHVKHWGLEDEFGLAKTSARCYVNCRECKLNSHKQRIS